MSKRTFLLILILAAGAFFRFYQIAEIPPGLYPDEAMNGNNALEALATGDFKVFYPENNGREGLFINLQALSLWVFGNEPWALRVVSAIFGTITLLGIYLLARELFYQPPQIQNAKIKSQNYNSKFKIESAAAIALLSTFFLATSYWHINFSRIGFRAIMVPFITAFAMYFLLRGLRRGKTLDMVWAGIFTGLGFYTYIAFRFFPFVLAIPILWYLWKWWKKETSTCVPCAILLFSLVTIAAATPMALYFLQNPQDFFGRTDQVSIFSADNPLLGFAKSNAATLGMFFVRGDCNWRHNFNCQPFLLNGILLIIGLTVLIRAFFRKPATYNLQPTILFAWLFFLSLPATLTKDGLPHALRSIGLIPPVMILSGFGAWRIYQKITEWLDRQKSKWPTRVGQLERIKKEVLVLSLLILILIPVMTYRNYFIRWASNENTYFSFATDTWHLGQYLNSLPHDMKKYVVVNLPGVDVRGIPMPAQTIMFATDSFREAERQKKNIEYVLPQDIINQLPVTSYQKKVIAFLDGSDKELISSIQKKFPELKIKVPGDFVILEN